MALIDCYECGGQVSTKAIACPHCGAPSEVVRPGDNESTRRIDPPSGAVKAGTGSMAIMGATDKPHVMTWVARAYFTIGGLIATPIMPTQGYDALIAYLAQYLLLGLGIAVMAFGYSREPRDLAANNAVLFGWVYMLVIASAIVSANIARLT